MILSVKQWGFVVAFFAGLMIYNTVMTNTYSYGATLHDSGIFATNIWHAGWELIEANTLDSKKFFMTHFSPILYIPNLFSYYYPGDRISYYAIVYALVFAALIYQVYAIVLPLFSNRFAAPLAACAAFAYFCSQVIFLSTWEMRMEQASPLFILLMFNAWQHRKYRMAIFWLLVNNSVREDLGAIYSIPIALLAGAQWMQLRYTDKALAMERLRWGIRLTAISVASTVIAVTLQKTFYPGFDMFHGVYFDKDQPFGHLTSDVLLSRAEVLFYSRYAIWLPLALLAIASFAYNDLPLLVASVAFLPYLFINFLSKDNLSAVMDSYKPFPFALAMVWPALMAIPYPGLRKRYLYLQVAVLLAGLIDLPFTNRSHEFIRWVGKTESHYIQNYRDFGAQLPKFTPTDTGVYVTHGILALYPYQFGSWSRIDVASLNEADFSKVNEMIWFEGDRDQMVVNKILKAVHFSTITGVPGTKLHMAKK